LKMIILFNKELKIIKINQKIILFKMNLLNSLTS
jgi:hypothetical protein